MTMLNLDWIAGFYDGEGCFTLMKQRSGPTTYWYPRIYLVQCNRPILELVADTLMVPDKIYSRPGGSATAKEIFTLVIQTSDHVRRVCKLLAPRLILKKRQAEFLSSTLSVPPRERQSHAGVLSSMK